MQWTKLTPTCSLFFKYKIVFWEFISTVIVKNLDSNCEYEYQVGAGFHMSAVTRVPGRTPYYAANPVKSNQPAKVVMVGDMGRGPESLATRSFLKKYLDANKDVAAILHLGDVAYNLDYMGGTVGDEYLREMTGIIDRIPYMITPGNHEAAHNFTHLRTRFRMPRTFDNDYSGLFYSFNLGRAHFTMYSTEVYEYSENQTQRIHKEWLESDLKSADLRREETPWVFVLGHKPQYCNIDWTKPMKSIPGFRSNDNCNRQSAQLREKFEDVFYTNAVDVVFSGHVHRYEREAAVYRNVTVPSEFDAWNYHFNPKAAVHILSGIGGSDHLKNPLSPTPQLWNRAESNDYGFGVLTVFNHTHIYWEQWDAERERVVDWVWIEKSRLRY